MYRSLMLASFSLLWLVHSVGADDPAREQYDQGMDLVSHGSRYHDQALLLEGRGVLERVQVSHPGNAMATYYLAYAEYELIRHGMVTKDSELFDRYVDSAVAHARQVLALRPRWSEGLALLANIYGIEISHSWTKAPTLGPEANVLAEQAIMSDSANPRAWLVDGIMKFNTPVFLGGSVEVALTDFTRALELFDTPSQREPLSPDWGHLETYAWRGKALEKNDHLDDALASYMKALEIDPEFVWVKKVLLPALNEKLADQSSR